MELPPSGTNRLASPTYPQSYAPVQQIYAGREQEFTGYIQKMGDPYYSAQQSASTAPVYPTPLPAVVESRFGGGGNEMGPMMRALTEDDLFMPQPPEYRSPMQTVSASYGQAIGYNSADVARNPYLPQGQYPSPFSPGHSPRTSQMYPVRSHSMSPHDTGYIAPQYHRQTSQSPHLVSTSSAAFSRVPPGIATPLPYSHSPGSSQSRSNSQFPFCTSPVSQHTSPLPSPSSLRSPMVLQSPHNLASASPGPFNPPSNPSPITVPRPIKSPLAAFQMPVKHPKVHPVDNGDKSLAGTPYVELVHSRTSMKNDSVTGKVSPENPYPKKECSTSGHLPKLEEMVAFLGEPTTKGILTPKDIEASVETAETNPVNHSLDSVSNSEQFRFDNNFDIADAEHKITVQENNGCSHGSGPRFISNNSPTLSRDSPDGRTPSHHRSNGEVTSRSHIGERSPREGNNHNNASRHQNDIPMSQNYDSAPAISGQPALGPKMTSEISRIDKNSMGSDNLKRKFPDVYNCNTYSRNGGQSVTAFPLEYSPTNGNDLKPYRSSSPRGSKSPGRKSKEAFEGSPRRVFKTYSGKKKRSSVDKQGNAIVLPSPLLPLFMTNPSPQSVELRQNEEPLRPGYSPDANPSPEVELSSEMKPPPEISHPAEVPPAPLSRNTSPTFFNPMSTPSNRCLSPDALLVQKTPPPTPTAQTTSDDQTLSNSSKKRGRPVGSKNRPRKDGELPKRRRKPVKKNLTSTLEASCKEELSKFKHLSKGKTAEIPAALRQTGPVLRFAGTRLNPKSGSVVNYPGTVDASSGKEPVHKKRGSKTKKAPNQMSHGPTNRSPLGPPTKHSPSSNNPTGIWRCALCGKTTNDYFLGDLYGPYYPPGYQVPNISTSEDKPKLDSSSHKKQAKVHLDPMPMPDLSAAPSKLTGRATARSGSVSRRRQKVPEDTEYLLLLDEQITSSGRVSKTPRRMSYEMIKEPLPRSCIRKRKLSGLDDRGGSESSEYWVHEDCVIWSQGVYVVGSTLYGLAEAIQATKSTKCVECKATGASLGCLSKGCKTVYHYVCAIQAECQFLHENYSMICPQHKNKLVKMKELT